MSYKDDEELNTSGEVDINEEDADLLISEDDLDDPLLADDDILADDDLLLEDEEEEDDLSEFAGLDGSEY